MNALTNALVFLINTAFEIVLFIAVLRFLFQVTRVNFQNSIYKWVMNVTNPIVRPVQKVLPVVRGVDLALVLIILFLEMLKLFFVTLLTMGMIPNVFGLIVASAGLALSLLVNIYFYGILAKVILSWINPLHIGSVSEVLYVMTEPVLRMVRNRLPATVTGIDFSPLVVIIVLQVLSILIVTPIVSVGNALLF